MRIIEREIGELPARTESIHTDRWLSLTVNLG